MSIFFTQGLM